MIVHRAIVPLFLVVLFIPFFTIATLVSHETQTGLHSQTVKFEFYPHTYDKCPDLPSPFTMDDGIEIVLAITVNQKFTLIPVTVDKGDSLGYRENDWDKIRILYVEEKDFPTLARTGLHSEIELDYTRQITGLSVAEITSSGRPGASSGEGFMARNEDIVSVLRGDNRLVKKLGLTHPQLAKPLFHVWNLIRWVNYKNQSFRRSRTIDGIDHFLYNGQKIHILNSGGRGWQPSIFNDEILGMYHIEFSMELDDDQKAFVRTRYPNLDNREQENLIKILSHIHTGEMVPFYIMRYGFYEGHTGYRADPIAVSHIFGLRSLEDIEKSFKGNLYKTLTEHFTRASISAGEGWR